MKNEIHHGVGLLISNLDQSHFFVQIKDEHYPFTEWRGACAYWGGAIEPEDADELAAVERELEEEIPTAARLLEKIPKNKIGKFWVKDSSQPFWLTLFDVKVTDKELTQISESQVLEGRGCLIEKTDLLNRKWIWKMDFIFQEYLKPLKNS